MKEGNSRIIYKGVIPLSPIGLHCCDTAYEPYLIVPSLLNTICCLLEQKNMCEDAGFSLDQGILGQRKGDRISVYATAAEMLLFPPPLQPVLHPSCPWTTPTTELPAPVGVAIVHAGPLAVCADGPEAGPWHCFHASMPGYVVVDHEIHHHKAPLVWATNETARNRMCGIDVNSQK